VPRDDELRVRRSGTDDHEAFRIMDGALEHGINFFDTANVYGWRRGDGRGEGITEQISAGGSRREAAGARRLFWRRRIYSTMGRVARRVQALCSAHPPCVR
jgi:diketogulonate reductase-like aldo/keto reductase